MPAPKGNQNAVKHGGEAAVKAIQSGAPFAALAAQTEQAVEADLDLGGRVALVKELAVRLQTASRLYWDAIQAAAERAQDDEQWLQKLDGYIARYGWLAGHALRAWGQHRAEEQDGPPTLDYDQLVLRLFNEDD